MYEQHFGLSDKPFRVVPSPRFLFVSDTHDESRARILYGIRESRGFIVVSGAVGLGKTTVLLSVLDELDERVRTALIFNPVETFEQLLRLICLEFGIEAEGGDEVSLLWDLNLFLVERMAEGETCVLLIDEAQNLSLDLLEKVRTLSNLQTESASLLQVVLVGQPELKTKLDDPRLVQLRQRVGVWHEIVPLSATETNDYVWHRLGLAGHRKPRVLFPEETCRRVFELGGGVPRLVNQLCDTALVIGFGAQTSIISKDIVDEAGRELRLITEETSSASAGVSPAVVPDVPRSATARRPESPLVAEKKSRTTLRWVAVVLIVLLLGWVGGQIAGLWAGPAAGWGPRTGNAFTTPETETGAPKQVAPPDGSGEDVAAEVTPAATPHPTADERAARAATVEEWRRNGYIVFSAHLASFHESEKVERFVRELLDAQLDWSQPIFVEDSGSGWLRVMGGGFRDRSEAQRWITELKGDRGLDYAQLERLDRTAVVWRGSSRG